MNPFWLGFALGFVCGMIAAALYWQPERGAG